MAVARSGYTVDDLDWVRSQMGVAHVELDPWGNLIVTPASDLHEEVAGILVRQLIHQLPDRGVGVSVLVNGGAWRVAGGSGYLYVPDLIVLAPGWRKRRDENFDPPPLLVVEIASPSTRVVDRTRKAEDYAHGGAGAYLLVDVPGQAPVTAPTFELRRPGEAPIIAEGRISFDIASTPVVLDLTALPLD